MQLHEFPAFAAVQLHPVVFSIFDLASVLQDLSEEITEIIVIGSVFETKVPDIREVLVELFWKTVAEVLDGSGLFLFSDFLVFLFVGRGLETLPWQAAA